MTYRLLFTILLAALLLACNSNQKAPEAEVEQQQQQQQQGTNVASQLPAGFPEFYNKFHRDSAFQFEHIQWPLRAIPDRPLAEGEEFFFQPDTWKRQQLISPTSGYVSHFTPLSDDLVVEQIVNKKDKTGLERRFLRDDAMGWKLIYYQGIRKFE